MIDSYKRAVEEIGGSFTDPDDDWQPICFLECDGEVKMLPLGPLIESVGKQMLMGVLVPYAIRHFAADTVIMVISAWMVTLEVDESLKGLTNEERNERAHEKLGGLTPSQHPDRKEIVLLSAIDTENSQFWLAAINRSTDKPPTLGKWDLTSERMGTQLSGLFIDPIREALRENDGET